MTGKNYDVLERRHKPAIRRYDLDMTALASYREGKYPNNFLYQGQEKVDLFNGSEYEFMLRNYQAELGRWNSVDPYDQFSNPYLGMANNPVNGVDPDGGFFFESGILNAASYMVAGAMIGGAYTALFTDEDPKKGALIGAGVGLGVYGLTKIDYKGLFSSGREVIDFGSEIEIESIDIGEYGKEIGQITAGSSKAININPEIGGFVINSLLQENGNILHPGKINLKDSRETDVAVHLLKGIRYHSLTDTKIDLTQLFSCLDHNCNLFPGTHADGRTSINMGGNAIDFYYEIPFHGVKVGLKSFEVRNYRTHYSGDGLWMIRWGHGGISITVHQNNERLIRKYLGL